MVTRSEPSTPLWQIERAAKLQRACQCLNAAVQRGESVSKAIRRISRRYHKRPYQSHPARRLALAPGTLRQLWHRWKRGGEVSAAFKLHYYGLPPVMPRPLLIRFVEYCAANRLPSVKDAWAKFSKHVQNARAKEFSYGQVNYTFSAAAFYQLQAELKAIEKAQARLDKIRFAAIATITNRLPERTPRRRVKAENTFEI